MICCMIIFNYHTKKTKYYSNKKHIAYRIKYKYSFCFFSTRIYSFFFVIDNITSRFLYFVFIPLIHNQIFFFLSFSSSTKLFYAFIFTSTNNNLFLYSLWYTIIHIASTCVILREQCFYIILKKRERGEK